MAQPGVLPVEGYSNTSWVVLHAVVCKLGLFHHVWTPKILALICVAGTFWQLQEFASRRILACLACSFLALNPSFTIWCASGLENSLYALLAVSLLRVCVNEVIGTRVVVTAAALTLGLVATRPDGLAFLAAPVAVWGLRAWQDASQHKVILRHIAAYLALTLALIGLGFLARHAYFGAWLPNTYLAKGSGTGGLALLAIAKLATVALTLLAGQRFFAARCLTPVSVIAMLVLGAVLFVALRLHPSLRCLARDGGIVLAGVVFAFAVFSRRTRRLDALFLFAGLGVFIHQAMPRDWMGESRFATALLPFWALLIVEACGQLPTGHARSRIALLGTVALLVIAVGVQRTLRFRESPTVPLAQVANQSLALERVARSLKQRPGDKQTVMLADIGALLLFGDLLVFDAGLLCDREMAQALHSGDMTRLHDYIFGQAKPSLIHTHPDQDLYLLLDGDPRFRHDYVAIEEWEQRKQETGNPHVACGLFVRKELVPASVTLTELRAHFLHRSAVR